MRRIISTFFVAAVLGLAKSESHNIVKRVKSSVIEDGVQFDDALSDRRDRQSGNSRSFNFPIILPPYNYIDLDNSANCLFYLESISVIVFPKNNIKGDKREYSSAVAVIGGPNDENKFAFEDSFVRCYVKNSTDRSFSFQVRVPNAKSEAKVHKDHPTALFSITSDIDFTLKFEIRNDSAWNLVDIVLNEPIVINAGDWVSKELRVEAGAPSFNVRSVRFGGFRDYSYACGNTPAIGWAVGSGTSAATIAITFNNIQLQPYDVFLVPEDKRKGKSKTYRFSTNVSDCVGTFSTGSWTGIIVALVLLVGLIFGYLMLNSVQTMDRFDDPKQKQLIINTKE